MAAEMGVGFYVQLSIALFDKDDWVTLPQAINGAKTS